MHLFKAGSTASQRRWFFLRQRRERIVAAAAAGTVLLGAAAVAFARAGAPPKRELGALMAETARVLPAAVFYLGYPAGLVALALTRLPQSLGQAVFRSALLGLVVYGVYDMTNLATLRGWSLKLALSDVAWGTLVAALAGAAAWTAMRWVAAR